MRFFAAGSIVLSGLSAVTAVFAAAHRDAEPLKRRHPAHVGLSGRSEAHLVGREDNARMTFYKTGLGACGKTNNDGENVVALNHAQFDSQDYCFKTITITYQGKSIQAQIVDRCVECPWGAIDLSPGLFNQFASQQDGTIYGSWELGSGAPPPPPPPPPPKTTSTKAKSTSTPPPEPTTTSSKSTTHTSETPTSSPSATDTSSVVSSSTTSAESSSSPAATPSTAPTGMIDQFLLAYQQVAGLATAASSSS